MKLTAARTACTARSSGRARVSRCTTGQETSPNLNPNSDCAIATRRDRIHAFLSVRVHLVIALSEATALNRFVDRTRNEKRSDDDSSCWLAARLTIAFTARARCCDWDAARGVLGFTVSRPPSLLRTPHAQLALSRSRARGLQSALPFAGRAVE